jgi:phosphohistidine swiveling domain-containing protein
MVGEKIKKLETLKKAGFNVPDFVAFGSETMEMHANEIAYHASNALNVQSFAVRSSAVIEDGAQSSMAGQFLTKVNVSQSELADAIDEVRNHAKQKLGDLKSFSLIIQEFIEADISGVTFTRNPQGGREMIIEFHQGRGDGIVGGKVTPTREIFFRTQKEYTSKIPNIIRAKTIFLEIEKLFCFPQDIEWCLKDEEIFIVQSRPITSLTSEKCDYWNQLERTLPSEGKFFFAKTEICDGVPSPSHDTFLLLQKLYEKDGPVDRAYRSFGIRYADTNFLVRLCGELYIDKERELKSLFPSHSYFFGKDYEPMPVNLSGFFTSLKNNTRLRSMCGNLDTYKSELRGLLEKSLQKVSYEQALSDFLGDYQVIFEVNLLTQVALRRLEQKLPKSTPLAEALSYVPSDVSEPLLPPTDATGNTLNLEDDASLKTTMTPGTSEGIPQEIPNNELHEAHEFLRLREYGRWLAQRHLARLRTFCRFAAADRIGGFVGPIEITDAPRETKSNNPLGVSQGKASGFLSTTPKKGCILVVHELNPELFAYKDLIAGVIAERGGMLSHFAILAREAGIPVVSNYPISGLHIGKQAKINGATGEVIFGEKDA